jgi:hypothetical protein
MPNPKSYVSEAESPDPPTTSRQPYVDVDTLRSSDGVKAVISQRRANGSFTFALFREFTHEGEIQQGAFFPETMLESYVRMLGMVRTRIVEIRKSGKNGKNEPLPFVIRQ